jgi:hypothetical protein
MELLPGPPDAQNLPVSRHVNHVGLSPRYQMAKAV